MKFIYGGPRKAIADGCNYIIFEKLNPEGIYCGQLYFEPKDLKEFQYKNHQNYRRSKTKLGGTEATCNLIPIEDLEGLVVRKEPSLEWQVAYWFERLPLEYQAVIIYLFFDGKYLRPMEDWIKNLEDLIYDHGFETIWEFLYAVTP